MMMERDKWCSSKFRERNVCRVVFRMYVSLSHLNDPRLYSVSPEREGNLGF